MKIIAVIATIVLSSLGLYLAVALNLFNKDKSAYVFESGLTTAEIVGNQVSIFLQRLIKDSLNIYNLLADRQLKAEQLIFPRSFDEVFPEKKSKSRANTERDILELSAKLKSATGRQADSVRTELAAAYLAKAQLMRVGGRQKSAVGSSKSGDLTAWKEPLRLAAALFTVEDEDGQDGKKSADATSADQHLVLGQIHRLLGDYDQAVTEFSAVIARFSSDPRIPVATFWLAESLFAKRDYTGAAEQYRKALKGTKARESVFSLYKSVWAYGLTGNAKAALSYLEKIRQLGGKFPAPLRADVNAFAVQIFAEAKDLGAAEKFYRGEKDSGSWMQAVRLDMEALKNGVAAGKGATNLLESRRLLRSLFYGDPDVVEFSVYESLKQGKGNRAGAPGLLVRMVNKDYLSENNLNEYYLDRVNEEKPVNFAAVTPDKPLLMNSSLKGGMGLLTLVRQDPLTGRYLLVRARMERFLNVFTQNRVYTTYMISAAGDLFAHKDPRRLVDDVNMLEERYVTDIIKSGLKTGVRELEDKSGTEIIVAYTDIGLFNLLVFSEIKKSKAFLAARELTKKSLYYGVFLIAIAIMVGILFAKSLTTPIDTLFKGTKIIAGGDFKTRVAVRSQDEIGVLADSFNFMAGRIVSLLEQEKDKVRMEQELKVAKLVQDSFFPANKVVAGNLDISAFYTPSSECGGDWWGLLRSGNKTMIMIGDATGHGVPAALITATAASCSTTIQELGNIHPDLLDSPARILHLLNKAVYGAAQGKILMTFFVCVIDPDTMTVRYSNASHNPPYLYKFNDAAEPSKKDLKAMMEAVGYRLGHKPDATYEDAEMSLSAQDMMVFFTDGFIECTNPQKEEYGNRKFIKSILKHMKGPSEDACAGIVGEAREFFADQPLADDLTMVVAKVLPEVMSDAGAAGTAA